MEAKSLPTSPKATGALLVRPDAAAAATPVVFSSIPPDSTSDVAGSVGGGKSDDMGAVLPLSCAAAAGAASSANYEYLPRTSLEYITSALFVIIITFFCAYEIFCVGRDHHDELKTNLSPPWALYRWLGSKGVDVADLQFYYFLVAVPPAIPYLVGFLIISRRLRRSAALKEAVMVSEVITSPSRDGKERIGSTSGSRLTDNAIGGGISGSSNYSPPLAVRKDMFVLQVFHIISGMFIALCLCGPGFLFGVVLMLLNFYLIAPLYKKASFRVSMAVMWMWHIAVLLLNFHSDGYRFSWLGLSFLDDPWTPLIRWVTQYNMSVLRMISFNNDLWESARCGEERRQKSLVKHARTCIACAQIREQHRHAAASLPQEAFSCYKCRTECSRHVEEFTLSAYLGYILYLPLFMAGPLSSFNAYVSFQHYPARSVVGMAVWRYGLRCLYYAIVLITLMHYVPIMAILLTPAAVPANGAVAVASASGAVEAEATLPVPAPTAPLMTTTGALAMPMNSPAWSQLSNMVSAAHVTTTSTAAAPTHSVFKQMAFGDKMSLFSLALAFLWLKFSLIWRFFRFCALLDGFDPPEDMPRCFANTVSIQSFWRDWHASFNLWIVRYMYIPMGGNRTKLFSILPIFFFIAIWHDMQLRLLLWATIICFTFIIEIAITLFFSKNNPLVRRLKRSPLVWRHLRVLGTQLGLIELAVANLVGFSIGADSAAATARQMFDSMTLLNKVIPVFMFLCMAVIAVQQGDQKAYEERQLKIKYGLH
ncbi:hypothetical protein GH5_07469 [Leishmania sp. Ghana 2012 LV757]|uniref:hypothetical protein n=1 Tax=Leishmania sp. Ghana 2012 LV757 TaxID=2803181 RepID=UPI001B5F3D2F|nr:hypothetical protein GH5_07469 [Leishmania sp. Ghana 2012 LV757]